MGCEERQWRIRYWAGHGFSGRSGPDKPKAQVFEDIPDDQWVFDAADDPHGSLTLTDQRIDLVYLPHQACRAPPERLFVSQRFEDAGNAVVAPVLKPFPP